MAFGFQPRDLSNINATVLNNQFINSKKGVQIESGGTNGVVMSTLIGNQFSNNTQMISWASLQVRTQIHSALA